VHAPLVTSSREKLQLFTPLAQQGAAAIRAETRLKEAGEKDLLEGVLGTLKSWVQECLAREERRQGAPSAAAGYSLLGPAQDRKEERGSEERGGKRKDEGKGIMAPGRDSCERAAQGEDGEEASDDSGSDSDSDEDSS